MMKVLAKRDSANVYLIGEGTESLSDMGFVADFENKIKGPLMKVHAILNKGYWESCEDDRDIVFDANALPAAPTKE